MSDEHRIQTLAELREVIPEPSAMLEQKIFDRIDPFARRFIERAPLLFISTVDADGGVDESFFHCGKALIRSSLWKPETWPKDFETNLGKQIASRSNADAKLADAIEQGLEQDYITGL